MDGKMPKIIFVDLDGVLADFDAAITSGPGFDPPEMFVPGFFRNLAVTPGSKEAIATLLANPNYEVYVGSKHTSKVTTCTSEKVEWVKEHFPALLRNMVLCCDKKLLRGDILIDDDLERWGHVFVGTFIHFDRTNHAESWKKVLEILKER
jgi:5'(3')-deoxyribonucleotidase